MSDRTREDKKRSPSAPSPDDQDTQVIPPPSPPVPWDASPGRAMSSPPVAENQDPQVFETTTTSPSLWRPPRDVPLPGRTVAGRYTVLDRLGEGGMSVVLAAYDVRLDRRVALKLLNPRPGTAQERSELRMVREAQAMARLNHPHVVAVYDSGTLEDGSLFIAMEYVEGQTLRQWHAEKPRNWREVLEVFLAAGRGLAAAHQAGLVHRDFKPDNVLVGRDGRVRVTDFGVARTESSSGGPVLALPMPLPPGAWDTSLTQPGFVVGTPRYLAPELLQGASADARSDLFSFCVALYEALCGQPAFAGSTDRERSLARIEGRITPPPPQLPGWLMRAVLQGLSPQPAQRPASMPVLLKALAEDPALRRGVWIRGALVASVGLGLAALAAWGWWGQQEQGPRCSQMPSRLDGVWDGAVQQRIRQALEGTGLPYAPATADRVSAALEGYARTWGRMRVEACEAARGQARESRGLAVLQEYCLERRRSQLRAVTELLGRGPDPELVPRAVEAAQALPPLEYCMDAQALMAAVPPPEDPRVRAQAEALHAEVDRLETLYEAGKYAEGMALGEQLLPKVEPVAHAPLRARTLYHFAQNLEGAGEFKRAEALAREAIPLAAEGRDDALTARSWGLLVLLVSNRQGRHDEAKGLQLITSAAAARTEDVLARAEALNALGMLFNGQEQYAEAREAFERARVLWEQVRGPKHPYVAGFRSNLGIALFLQGRYEEARQQSAGAQAVWEEVLGPEHPYLIHALISQGAALWRLGRLPEAVALLERAQALIEKGLGPEHPFLTEPLSVLGFVLTDMGRYPEARQRLSRSLALVEKVMGPEHPGVADPLLGLAHLHRLQGASAEALPLLERALERAQGSTRAEVQFELAQTLWQFQTRRPRARELATQAHAYWQRLEHPQSAQVQQWLSSHSLSP
ncbi:serine/threonine-protein kinase [Stigmatella aurantiaca]|uniref:Serine/threonine kinase family protein n=1 Tax=Stigmatella aurantiaca (strain DW4/3-1) TaxID=378806 RepID=Q098F1_STIAD|nr:serine/threonine-protein kinase [Stigmatella aurantiaca]ADO68073.1 Serine/threonine kinase family protein [Stigmatella aurantiaca DW4/3-1]EAU68163.1 serine/threonine-protein kinase Pkn3 [Stigmatella aurantiaca DW4/3-1]